MKYLSTIFLFVSFSVFADWQYITSSQNSKEHYFIDSKTIKSKNNKVKYWEKINCEEEKNYKSIRRYQEMDCFERTRTLLQMTLFEEIDLKGAVYTSSDEVQKFYVAPDTINEEILEYVCK